jgi:phosphoglycerate dehydrogenase-like enzyme
MTGSTRRVPSALVSIMAALLAGTAAATPPPAPGTEAMIRELGLRESERPVRDMPGWRPPGKIVVWADGTVSADALRAAAPGVELVFVDGWDEAVAALPEAQALLGPCRTALVEAGEALHWVQSYSAGVDRCVEAAAFRERPMVLTNAQRLYGPAIAEHVIGMTLMLARGLDVYHRRQPEGGWQRGMGDFADTTWELSGRTMLVVGLGGIGTEIARRAAALGMRVVATRNSSRRGPEFVARVGLADELHTLAAEADVIVNATPLTDATRGLFDAEFFDAAKHGAYFINIGRGESVVQSDLLAALADGRLAGAGLDVTDPEPLPADHPLWTTPRVIITPHVSARTAGSGERRARLVVENLRRYVAGEPMLSVVDVGRGY